MAGVLVFGRQGQVANALQRQFLKSPGAGDWTFLSSQEVDFTKPDQVSKTLKKFHPSLVINTSAFTAVDKAESEKDQAWAVNAKAPEMIASWCAQNEASLIHFSTDYVYPGTGETPWKESDLQEPQNEYGRSKSAGDLAIEQSGCHHLVLRTSWVYSDVGTNFMKTMIKLGAERDEIRVVQDQFGSPTSAQELALAVLHLIQHPRFQNERKSGVYHLAGMGYTSWYGFAKKIFELAKEQNFPIKVQSVLPVSSSEYVTLARRPLNSRLDQARIQKDFSWFSRPWEQSLKSVLEAYANR